MSTNRHTEGSNPSVCASPGRSARLGKTAAVDVVTAGAGDPWLLMVNAGIDARDALAEASNMMACTTALMDNVAGGSLADHVGFSCAAEYLNRIAKAVVDAVHQGQEPGIVRKATHGAIFGGITVKSGDLLVRLTSE